MHCPFCGGPLARGESHDTIDTMETGGAWRTDAWTCAPCGCELEHDVVFKVGSARERWSVLAVGSAKPSSSQLFCPACDGPIVSARPVDALNEPATGFDEKPVKNARETEHVCAGCGKRYLLSERVESTWQRLDADAHVPIAPPKPFSREDD